jgi:outer membrane protein
MSIVDRPPYILRYVLVFTLVVGLFTTAKGQNAFSLKECISYGLAHHPSINVSRNNIENANQAAREALAGYLPQVNVNVNATNNLKLQTTIIPAGAFSPTEQRLSFGNKYTTSFVADASQPIYNQALLTGIKASKPNKELANLSLEQSRQNIIYNVVSSYYQVIINQRQLQLLQSNKERIQRLLKVSTLQSQMGVAKKVDTKQVQVQLNNVEAQISIAENNIDLANNSLKNAMGIFGSEEQIVLTDTARWLRQEQVSLRQPGFRFNNTIDYQLQEKQIELYDLQAKTIKAGNYPTLSLFGQYGLNGFGGNASDAFGRYFDYSAIGVRASVSLFDGFRRSAQYQQAIVQRDNARLNQTINQASQNLQFLNAGSRVQRAQATLQTNRNNLDLATEVYENTSLQYRQGVGTLSDLLNAETSYNQAQNNYIQSLIDLYISQIDIERANTTLDAYYEAL